MDFNDVMVAVRDSASQSLDIPEKWGQGRATFGGLIAAAMLQKMMSEIGSQRPLRSLSLSFVAPVAPGALEVQIKLLREGKAATQVQATAIQQEQVCAVLTWNLSVVQGPQDCSGNDWWQYRAAIQSSANGYSHIDATLWDKHGRACVISRQTVSVFA